MHESKLLQGHLGAPVLMLVIAFVCSLGIFRENGPVKAFNEPIWRLKGVKGGSVLLRSLDDLAEYRFGGKFDDLPAGQQSDVLGTYRVGNYFYPAASSKAPSRLDERERIEKDRAYSATLVSLTRYLFIVAGVYSVRRSGPSSIEVMALLISLGFIGQNGPKASILWNEPTPFPSGELRVVGEKVTG